MSFEKYSYFLKIKTKRKVNLIQSCQKNQSRLIFYIPYYFQQNNLNKYQLPSYMHNNHNYNTYFKQNLSPQIFSSKYAFKSPTRNLVDYNSFMINQKKHPKVENSKNNGLVNRTMITSPRRMKRVTSEADYKCEMLEVQNTFLINQLMVQKQKEEQYKRHIHKLKHQKSTQNLIRPSTNHISIRDRAQPYRPESHFSSDMFNTMKSVDTMKTFEDEPSQLTTVINQSEEYLKHTQKSLSNEIQILNDRLCKLLEEISHEQDKTTKQRKRKQMYDCVQEIKELREYQKKHFSLQ